MSFITSLNDVSNDETVRIIITINNYTDLPNFVTKLKDSNIKKIEFIFDPDFKINGKEIVYPTITSLLPYLYEALDRGIIFDIDVSVRGLPYCFMVGYKRYTVSGDRERKLKPESCKRCKYYQSCDGIWKTYLEKHGYKEIVPITGEIVLTDNDRCMIYILKKVGKATTKQIFELKSSDEFKDVCANCVSSDDVLVTGNNLLKKGIVERILGPEGYVWILKKDHPLIKIV